MNGQVGHQPVTGLLAPIHTVCLHCQWNAGPAQLLAFGSIGVEFADLCCKFIITNSYTVYEASSENYHVYTLLTQGSNEQPIESILK